MRLEGEGAQSRTEVDQLQAEVAALQAALAADKREVRRVNSLRTLT